MLTILMRIWTWWFSTPQTEESAFHPNYKDTIPYRNTPIEVMYLIRKLMTALDMTQTEVEIVLGFYAHDASSVTLDYLLTYVNHISLPHLKNTVKNLVADDFLEMTERQGMKFYKVSEKTKDVIKNMT